MIQEANVSLPPLEPAEEWYRARRRKRIVIWGTSAVLAAAGLVGGSKYGYPVLQEQRAMLAQLPGMQSTLAAVGKRVDDAEEKWRAWISDRDNLRLRMAKVESAMSHSLQLAKKQSQELTARLQAQLDSRTEMMQSRLARLESTQESESARVARLQEELATVRHEMRRDMDQQLILARQESRQSLDRIDQHLTKLDQQADTSRRDLGSISQQLERQRVDFEVSRNRSREVAPGISLTITRTDPRYRRFDGWVWLLPDRRTVWVRGQGAHQPVVFYSKQDNRPHEMVITHVSNNGVAGYVMVPGSRSDSPAGSAQ